MDLKEILGEELYEQFESKVSEVNANEDRKDNPVKFVDLSEGAYVGKEKYTSMQTEVNGYKTQLGEVNNVIKSYEKMDIDGIKKSATEWQSKYETDTAKLQADLENERKIFAAEKYLDNHKIKSPLSKKAILQEFVSKDFEYKDGKFNGADDYMKEIKEKYPDEFINEKEEPKKTWVRGTQNTFKPQTASEEETYMKNKYSKNKYYKGK